MNDQNLPTEVSTQSPTAIAKAGMAPGGAIAALVPQSLDDAFRLAKALAMSGDMVPKHFQGKPEMTMAAIVRGMEIGLAPMQALSNIAVINGRATIWGDALVALLQMKGHSIDCKIEGDGDARKAVATVKRGDTGEAIVRSFSVADAKKAGLWGKQGPWQAYPDRMLSMRARSFAARDGAADALMGLQVAEEVNDYQPIRDVTPKEGGFADMARKARDPVQSVEVRSDAQFVEVSSVNPEAQDGLWRDLANDGVPGGAAFERGRSDFESGLPIQACPYDAGAALEDARDWCAGWCGAERAKA